jgi:integrase
MSDEPIRPRRQRLNTVREVCQAYLERGVGDKHGPGWDTVRVIVNGFMEVAGDLALDDLICDDLESWIEKHDGWKSNWTKKRVAVQVKRAFNWAEKKGLIIGNPLKGVSYPAGDNGDAMDEDTFRMYLREASPDVRRVLLFMWWTGCRPIELCRFKWEHIDVDRGVIVQREHKTMHSRKDKAPRTIVLPDKALRLLIWILRGVTVDASKEVPGYGRITRNGEPWLCAAVAAERIGCSTGVLRWWRREGCPHLPGRAKLDCYEQPPHQPGLLKGHYFPEAQIDIIAQAYRQRGDGGDYVFVNSMKRAWARAHLGSMFTRIRKRLGLPNASAMRPYGARHAYGTRLALAGVELKTLSTLMGHSNTLMSERYIHIAGKVEHLRDALEKSLASKPKADEKTP